MKPDKDPGIIRSAPQVVPFNDGAKQCIGVSSKREHDLIRKKFKVLCPEQKQLTRAIGHSRPLSVGFTADGSSAVVAPLTPEGDGGSRLEARSVVSVRCGKLYRRVGRTVDWKESNPDQHLI